MFEIPIPLPAGMVAQVVQPGYMIGERMLRPALSGSPGGPKVAEPPANTTSGNLVRPAALGLTLRATSIRHAGAG